MKKETLEEVAERLYSDKEYPMYGEIRRHSFIAGAKWQMDNQDEFAIGFAEWFDDLDEGYCKNYTIKELLEIYKKGL